MIQYALYVLAYEKYFIFDYIMIYVSWLNMPSILCF